VLGVILLSGLLGIIAMVSMSSASETANLDELLGWKNLVRQVLNLFVTTVLLYYSLNYYYELIVQRKTFIYYLRFSLIYALACILYSIGRDHLLPVHASNQKVTAGLIIFAYSITTIFYVGITLLVSYFTSLRDDRKQRKILEQQKMQLEVEKSQANFNFLKAQINPHFLHNTLNFLYAKSLPFSNELSEGILTLSDIMRYALSEGNAKDGKALLKDEIEHVNNVIKINQLRFSNNLNVKFEVSGMVNGATIIPFVLITLVENSFKHGDLKNSSSPIEIRLKVDDEQIYFFCRNKKKTGPKEISTGLGLDNIKKRLDLAYGKDYVLNIRNETEIYSTELIIKRQ
jgi:two-component system LytT family sensor kinase